MSAPASPTAGFSLPAILRQRAHSDPDRVFVQEVGGAELTYRDLEERVHAWAALLTARGVTAGDHVLTMLPTNGDCVAVWLAIARLGAVEVSVNTALHGPLLSAVAQDSGAHHAVVDVDWRTRFADIDDLALMSAADVTPVDTSQLADLPKEDLEGHEIATVVFTSGTTGRSKGVLIPWRQMYESARWCVPLDEATEDDHWYVPLPMFHVSGKISVYAAALTGARAVLRNGFSTSQFWKEVVAFECTTALLPGSAARYLEGQPEHPDDAANPLRNVFVAPFPRDRDAFAQRFDVRLTTAFNMTEVSCPIVSGWEKGPEGSCGRARPGVQARIVDEHDHEVPTGEVGELVLRTDAPWEMMAGYLGSPEATTHAWRNLWFHTGDRCWRDEHGWYYFADRAGDAIRRRGENVSSAELEALLLSHPEVAEAAVIGVPSEWGEHDIHAYFLLKPDAETTLAEFSGTAVPKHMAPRFITIVTDFPRTPSQRVQKTRLRLQPPDAPTLDRGN